MQVGNSADLAPPPGTSPAEGEKEEKKPSAEAPEQRDLYIRAQRRKLPDERKSITHKFAIGGHEGYIIVGMYKEGNPGEIFIKMAKEGSTLSGFMDGLALSISIGLQYGVPLKGIVDKLTNTRFEPPDTRRIQTFVTPVPCWTILRAGSAANFFRRNISNRRLPLTRRKWPHRRLTLRQ